MGGLGRHPHPLDKLRAKEGRGRRWIPAFARMTFGIGRCDWVEVWVEYWLPASRGRAVRESPLRVLEGVRGIRWVLGRLGPG